MTVKVWNDSIIPAGMFARQPLGCILHGSRSDVAGRSPGQELASTITWARTNPKGLGWNATGGPDVYVTHLPASQWGWNAYEASALWLAYEFTQPTILDPITDAHVRAFVTWWQRAVLPVWPGLEPTLATLVCHSELPEGIREGKKTKNNYPLELVVADDLSNEPGVWYLADKSMGREPLTCWEVQSPRPAPQNGQPVPQNAEVYFSQEAHAGVAISNPPFIQRNEP